MAASRIPTVVCCVSLAWACADNIVPAPEAPPAPAYEPDPLPVIDFCELTADMPAPMIDMSPTALIGLLTMLSTCVELDFANFAIVLAECSLAVGTTSISFNGTITIDPVPQSIRITGEGQIEAEGLVSPIVANEVVILAGDCLPSSGSVELEAQGVPAILEFLPTTPEDGVARVDLGAFGTTTAILPCNGSCGSAPKPIP